MPSGGVTAASKECADKAPAGGFILEPPPESGQNQFATHSAGKGSPGGLSTRYAVHAIGGQKGDIFITFAATYNMTNSAVPVKTANGPTVDVQPLTTGPDCTWVITGGTGANTGVQGSGTCFGDGEHTFPWINHTGHGTESDLEGSHQLYPQHGILRSGGTAGAYSMAGDGRHE
jgi:hypothetical protein